MLPANGDSFDEFEIALQRAWEILRDRAESPHRRLVHSTDPLNEYANPVHTISDVNQNSLEKGASVASNPGPRSQAGR
jgi:hypothetical protein